MCGVRQTRDRAVDRRYTDLCEYGGQCDVRQTTDSAVDKRYTDLKSTENSVRRQTNNKSWRGIHHVFIQYMAGKTSGVFIRYMAGKTSGVFMQYMAGKSSGVLIVYVS